jgi:hypothetical protein
MLPVAPSSCPARRRKSGMTHFHPTQRFALPGLNAAFAANSGHSQDRDRAARVDPEPTSKISAV